MMEREANMSFRTPPEIQALENQILELKKELTKKRLELERESVEDFVLSTLDGDPVPLSALFGPHDELLAIHNMGAGCTYCSLWADGLQAYAAKMQERCALVLVTPDPPARAKAFADQRGWTFPIVSSAGSTFHHELGYADEKSVWPGVSALRKQPDGTLQRTSHAPFGPGDDFCSIWAFFDLFPDGAAGWEPR